MFCPSCGAKLPDDSLFCEQCGKRLEEYVMPARQAPAAAPARPTPAAPAVPAAPAPPVQQSVPAGAPFARTLTLTEAAGYAIRRNAAGMWCFWDDTDYFGDDARSVLRYCQKEDKRISGSSDRDGIQYYVVSPAGSIGQVYLDDEERKLILEWLFYTDDNEPETLPQTPEALPPG